MTRKVFYPPWDGGKNFCNDLLQNTHGSWSTQRHRAHQHTNHSLDIEIPLNFFKKSQKSTFFRSNSEIVDQIWKRNQILKNYNSMNSSLKLIRLSSRPFSISRKHYIKKQWGNFTSKKFFNYHFVSHTPNPDSEIPQKIFKSKIYFSSSLVKRFDFVN